MKTLGNFLKTTLVGGLVVVVPVWLVVLLLLKALKGVITLLLPIARLVPQDFAHENLVALVLLLAVCFLAGLSMRTPAVRRFGRWQEQRFWEAIPGYTLLRGLTRQLAGEKEGQAFQPALLEIEEALGPGFIIEEHPDGQFTVFVPSSPTPMAGAIFILPPDRVHPVDMPLHQAMRSISKWGAGTGQWLAAMRTKEYKEVPS